MSLPALSIVIPVHNEAAQLRTAVGELMDRLRALDLSFEIVLSENGSTDDTRALAHALAAEQAEVRVVELPEGNYGRALRIGMEAARGRLIVNFDIDYWDVPFVRDAWGLTQHRFDIIIGSKNLLLSSDRRGWVRRVVSQAFRLVLTLFFGLRVSDTHGIKAWKHTPALERLMSQVRFDHHLFDTELIIRGQRAGLRIAELPVEVIETRRAPWGILRRIPKALADIVGLRLLLWRQR